ncbi:hypothetical protein SLOPH_593, partial [Spraguea lophii 42_110]
DIEDIKNINGNMYNSLLLNNKYLIENNLLYEITLKNKYNGILNVNIKDIIIIDGIYVIQSIDNDIYFCYKDNNDKCNSDNNGNKYNKCNSDNNGNDHTDPKQNINNITLIEIYSIIGCITEITDIKKYKDNIFICNNGELKCYNNDYDNRNSLVDYNDYNINNNDYENNKNSLITDNDYENRSIIKNKILDNKDIIEYITVVKEDEIIMEIEVGDYGMLVVSKNKIFILDINDLNDPRNKNINNIIYKNVINFTKDNIVTGSYIFIDNYYLITIGTDDGILYLYKNIENIYTSKIHNRGITNVNIFSINDVKDNIN